MHLLLRWLINALAVLLAAYVIPGIAVSDFYAAIIVALMFGILNALVRPLLILLTLPINILTLGLFTLVINALLLWFVGTVVQGFTVASFGAAFWGALLIWCVSWLTNTLLKGTI